MQRLTKLIAKNQKILANGGRLKSMMVNGAHQKKTNMIRLMQLNDANNAGNVHGGNILRLIEEAGFIVATKHCNKYDKENRSFCVMARVERTDFLQPMYVGELAHLSAKITYCSQHSLEVKVFVEAENIFSGNKRLTNKATLWYVSMSSKNGVTGISSVPPLPTLTSDENQKGRERYEKQKEDRESAVLKTSPDMYDEWSFSLNTPISAEAPGLHTVARAQSSLIHYVGVQDCGLHGFATGGGTMKLMDETAGICAARHCHTNVVTASMDATNFHQKIPKGGILHLKARPIFTSYKSIVIQVVVLLESKPKDDNDIQTSCSCTAFFTFVSLGPDGKTLPIPPLKLTSEIEKRRFDEAKLQYEQRKLTRQMSRSSM